MERRLRLAYLATPYRAKDPNGVRRNIARAVDIQDTLISWALQGLCDVYPINTVKMTEFQDRVDSDDYFLTGDREMIHVLRPGWDLLIACPRWRDSTGAQAEVELARALGIEVIEWEAFPAQMCRFAVENR